jgi:replicative DNA helicase
MGEHPGIQRGWTTHVPTISTGFKDLAMQLRVPVLAMAQLNRTMQ